MNNVKKNTDYIIDGSGNRLVSRNIVPDTTRQLFSCFLGEDEITIGDGSSMLALKPNVNFSKWSGEENLSILPYGDLALDLDLSNLSLATFSNGRISVSTQDNKLGWYTNVDSTNINNLKFGLILNQIPDSKYIVNILGVDYYQWQFQLVGWENFDFFYQGLWDESETIMFNGKSSHVQRDKDGKIIAIREIENQGSWAIYHKTKKNQIIGKTNYRNGRIGDFKRPKLIDNDGIFLCWVDLHIENGLYILAVPQNILDTAKYPLRFNDEFGNNSTGSAWDGGIENNASLVGAKETLSTAGDVSKLTAYLIGYSNPSDYKGIVYDDDGASATPGTLKGVTNATTFTPNNEATWVDLTFASALALAAGDWYPGVIGDGTSSAWYVRYDSTGGYNTYRTYAQWTTPDDPLSPDITNSDRRSCIYATYTPSGGGAVVTPYGYLSTNKGFW